MTDKEKSSLGGVCLDMGKNPPILYNHISFGVLSGRSCLGCQLIMSLLNEADQCFEC
jgi:hypothetical protein